MAIVLVFETHATTVDNEEGRATGWRPGQLSEQGRIQARQLGRRRRSDGITAVFSSDLARAAQTASIAFDGCAVPVLYDWRLRECDYGEHNGMPVTELRAGRREHLERPYPGGESWRQAIVRVGRFTRAALARLRSTDRARARHLVPSRSSPQDKSTRPSAGPVGLPSRLCTRIPPG